MASIADDPSKIQALEELDRDATNTLAVVDELLAGVPKFDPRKEKAEKLTPLGLKWGDVIERNGEKYMAVPVLINDREIGTRPVTYKEYYSHTFPVGTAGRRLPGPGWDSRFDLFNPEETLRRHDRKFTPDELNSMPASLPDEAMLRIENIDSHGVERYQEYLKKLEE